MKVTNNNEQMTRAFLTGLLAAMMMLVLAEQVGAESQVVALSSFPRSPRRGGRGAETTASALTARTYETLQLDDEFRRRFLGSGGARLLQNSTTTCASEEETALSCLSSKVGDLTEECAECIELKKEEALDEYRLNPTVECGLLNDNICAPVTECSCVEPCDNEISELYHCQIHAAFASDAATADLIANCTISCTGTNVTASEDDATKNDDFVSGLCAGEEAAVKLCLETMDTTLEECGACISETGALQVVNSTTCADLQENTCRHIASCACVQDCEDVFIALGNCDVEYGQVNFPNLQGCVQSGDQCQLDNGGGTSGGSTATSGSVVTKGPRSAMTIATFVAGMAFTIVAIIAAY
jgi:hypothetical protein